MDSVRKEIESAIDDLANRLFCEKLVCKIIRDGTRLPHSDEVIKMLDMLISKVPKEQMSILNPFEHEICFHVMVGLTYLAQLSMASERM